MEPTSDRKDSGTAPSEAAPATATAVGDSSSSPSQSQALAPASQDAAQNPLPMEPQGEGVVDEAELSARLGSSQTPPLPTATSHSNARSSASSNMIQEEVARLSRETVGGEDLDSRSSQSDLVLKATWGASRLLREHEEGSEACTSPSDLVAVAARAVQRYTASAYPSGTVEEEDEDEDESDRAIQPRIVPEAPNTTEVPQRVPENRYAKDDNEEKQEPQQSLSQPPAGTEETTAEVDAATAREDEEAGALLSTLQSATSTLVESMTANSLNRSLPKTLGFVRPLAMMHHQGSLSFTASSRAHHNPNTNTGGKGAAYMGEGSPSGPDQPQRHEGELVVPFPPPEGHVSSSTYGFARRPYIESSFSISPQRGEDGNGGPALTAAVAADASSTGAPTAFYASGTGAPPSTSHTAGPHSVLTRTDSTYTAGSRGLTQWHATHDPHGSRDFSEAVSTTTVGVPSVVAHRFANVIQGTSQPSLAQSESLSSALDQVAGHTQSSSSTGPNTTTSLTGTTTTATTTTTTSTNLQQRVGAAGTGHEGVGGGNSMSSGGGGSSLSGQPRAFPQSPGEASTSSHLGIATAGRGAGSSGGGGGGGGGSSSAPGSGGRSSGIGGAGQASVSSSYRLRSSHGSSSLGRRHESMSLGGGGGIGAVPSFNDSAGTGGVGEGSSFAGSLNLGQSGGSHRSRGGAGAPYVLPFPTAHTATNSGVGYSTGASVRDRSGAILGGAGHAAAMSTASVARSTSGGASFSVGRTEAGDCVSPSYPYGAFFGDEENSELQGTFAGHHLGTLASHDTTLSEDTFGTLVSTVHTTQRSGQSSLQQMYIFPPHTPRGASLSGSPAAAADAVRYAFADVDAGTNANMSGAGIPDSPSSAASRPGKPTASTRWAHERQVSDYLQQQMAAVTSMGHASAHTMSSGGTAADDFLAHILPSPTMRRRHRGTLPRGTDLGSEDGDEDDDDEHADSNLDGSRQSTGDNDVHAGTFRRRHGPLDKRPRDVMMTSGGYDGEREDESDDNGDEDSDDDEQLDEEAAMRRRSTDAHVTDLSSGSTRLDSQLQTKRYDSGMLPRVRRMTVSTGSASHVVLSSGEEGRDAAGCVSALPAHNIHASRAASGATTAVPGLWAAADAASTGTTVAASRPAGLRHDDLFGEIVEETRVCEEDMHSAAEMNASSQQPPPPPVEATGVASAAGAGLGNSNVRTPFPAVAPSNDAVPVPPSIQALLARLREREGTAVAGVAARSTSTSSRPSLDPIHQLHVQQMRTTTMIPRGPTPPEQTYADQPFQQFISSGSQYSSSVSQRHHHAREASTGNLSQPDGKESGGSRPSAPRAPVPPQPHHQPRPSCSFHGLPNSQMAFGNRRGSQGGDAEWDATDTAHHVRSGGGDGLAGSLQTENELSNDALTGIVAGHQDADNDVPQPPPTALNSAATTDMASSTLVTERTERQSSSHMGSESINNVFAETAKGRNFSFLSDDLTSASVGLINVGESLLSGMPLMTGPHRGSSNVCRPNVSSQTTTANTTTSSGTIIQDLGDTHRDRATAAADIEVPAQQQQQQQVLHLQAGAEEGLRPTGSASLVGGEDRSSRASSGEDLADSLRYRRHRMEKEEASTAVSALTGGAVLATSPASTQIPYPDDLGNSVVSSRSAEMDRYVMPGPRGTDGGPPIVPTTTATSRPPGKRHGGGGEGSGAECLPTFPPTSVTSQTSRDRTDSNSVSARTATTAYALADAAATSSILFPPLSVATTHVGGGGGGAESHLGRPTTPSSTFPGTGSTTGGGQRSGSGGGGGGAAGGGGPGTDHNDFSLLAEDDFMDTLTAETKETVAELSREVMADIAAEQLLRGQRSASDAANAAFLHHIGLLPLPPSAQTQTDEQHLQLQQQTSSSAASLLRTRVASSPLFPSEDDFPLRHAGAPTATPLSASDRNTMTPSSLSGRPQSLPPGLPLTSNPANPRFPPHLATAAAGVAMATTAPATGAAGSSVSPTSAVSPRTLGTDVAKSLLHPTYVGSSSGSGLGDGSVRSGTRRVTSDSRDRDEDGTDALASSSFHSGFSAGAVNALMTVAAPAAAAAGAGAGAGAPQGTLRPSVRYPVPNSQDSRTTPHTDSADQTTAELSARPPGRRLSTSNWSSGTTSADGATSSLVGGSFSTKAFHSDAAIPPGSFSTRSDHVLNSGRGNPGVGARVSPTQRQSPTPPHVHAAVGGSGQAVAAGALGIAPLSGQELESSIVSSVRSNRHLGATAVAAAAVAAAVFPLQPPSPPHPGKKKEQEQQQQQQEEEEHPQPLAQSTEPERAEGGVEVTGKGDVDDATSRTVLSRGPSAGTPDGGEDPEALQGQGGEGPVTSSTSPPHARSLGGDHENSAGTGLDSRSNSGLVPPPSFPVEHMQPTRPRSNTTDPSKNTTSSSYSSSNSPSFHNKISRGESTRVPPLQSSTLRGLGSHGGSGRSTRSDHTFSSHTHSPMYSGIPVPAPSVNYRSLSVNTNSRHQPNETDNSGSAVTGYENSLASSSRHPRSKSDSVLSLTSSSSCGSVTEELGEANGDDARHRSGTNTMDEQVKEETEAATATGPLAVPVTPSEKSREPLTTSQGAQHVDPTVAVATRAADLPDTRQQQQLSGHDDDDEFGDFGEVVVVPPTSSTAAEPGVSPEPAAAQAAPPPPPEVEVTPTEGNEDTRESNDSVPITLVSESAVSPESFWGTQLQQEHGSVARRSCLRQPKSDSSATDAVVHADGDRHARVSEAPPVVVDPPGPEYALEGSYFFNPVLDYCDSGSGDEDDEDTSADRLQTGKHNSTEALTAAATAKAKLSTLTDVDVDSAFARRLAHGHHNDAKHGGFLHGAPATSERKEPAQGATDARDGSGSDNEGRGSPQNAAASSTADSTTVPRVSLVRRVQLPTRRPAPAATAAATGSTNNATRFALPSALAPPPSASTGSGVSLRFAPPSGTVLSSGAPRHAISDSTDAARGPSSAVAQGGMPLAEKAEQQASSPTADGAPLTRETVGLPSPPSSLASPAAVTASVPANPTGPSAAEKRMQAQLAAAEAAGVEAHNQLLALGAVFRSPGNATDEEADGAGNKEESHRLWDSPLNAAPALLPPELADYLDDHRRQTDAAESSSVDAALLQRFEAVFETTSVATPEVSVEAAASASTLHDENKREDAHAVDPHAPDMVSRASDMALSRTLSALGFHPLRNRELLEPALPLWAALRPTSEDAGAKKPSPAPEDAPGATSVEPQGQAEPDDTRRASDLRASWMSGGNASATGSDHVSHPSASATATAAAALRALYPNHGSFASSVSFAHMTSQVGETGSATATDVMMMLQAQRRVRAAERGGGAGGGVSSVDALPDGTERASLADVLAAAQGTQASTAQGRQ